MLSDITFGQYIYGRSVIHRMDPRIKLIFSITLIIMLITAKTIAGFILNLVFVLTLYAFSGISFKMLFRSIKPILPIVIITGIFNIFFTPGNGDPLVSFWRINIYKQGIIIAGLFVVRIALIIVGSTLLTYTTSPIELTDAIERLLRPFKYLKLPVHELAMMMTIALRFIPLLIEETVKIMNAQKSRGADLDSGKLVQRVKALIPILVPLFISCFRRADELAMAMECRCYRGGEGRTRMKQLHLSWLDLSASIIFLFFCAGVIFSNYYFTRIL